MNLNLLKKLIQQQFNLDLEIKPFGDNTARNNVFAGESREGNSDFYIIKLESLKQADQVKVAILIAENLQKSSVLSSSTYIQAVSGDYYSVFEDKIVTVQVKEELKKLDIKSDEELLRLGEALAEFHKVLLDLNLENLKDSDFYNDFMGNEVPLAQTPERLVEINDFYKKYTPDYAKLTNGVVHNDLNSNNIFHLGDKLFFIDFELLKKSPLVSDLGVLSLELWKPEKGVGDYISKLDLLVKGYEKGIKLNEYDKKNIVVFSLRYLFSDENWYNYWSFNGNPDAINLIAGVREKEDLLLELVS